MARTSLAPGFRFHPTDVELVLYYLKSKVLGKRLRFEAIAVLDLYKFAPWDLPDKSCMRSRDLEWYFFCPRDRKYANGPRTNRATEIGYWKTTGRDRHIYYNSQTVGVKKTLIFHLGRAPKGNRTNWVMHEYRLEIKDLAEAGISQDLYVLCKIFEKSGAGPKNGEQHGAPFKEEEWEDDMVDNSVAPVPLGGSGSTSSVLDNDSVTENSTLVLELENRCGSSWEPCRNASCDASQENPSLLEDVDMESLLALLGDENDLCHSNEKLHLHCNVEAPPTLDGNDIFSGLEDLNTRVGVSTRDNLHLLDMEGGHVLDQSLLGDDIGYVELIDFEFPRKYPLKGNGPKQV